MDNFESYKQAKILLEQEKFSDALKIYQKLLENNQEDAYLWYKIGELFENLVTKIKEKFDCIGDPYAKWYWLYTKEPKEKNNCFAVIQCGVGTANICIRVNPKTFTNENELIRTVKGFFFSGDQEGERRISIKRDNLDKILTYLEHSVQITKDSNQKL